MRLPFRHLGWLRLVAARCPLRAAAPRSQAGTQVLDHLLPLYVAALPYCNRPELVDVDFGENRHMSHRTRKSETPWDDFMLRACGVD